MGRQVWFGETRPNLTQTGARMNPIFGQSSAMKGIP